MPPGGVLAPPLILLMPCPRSFSTLATIGISRYPHHMELRVALYQPDIPGNTGTILRMAACLGFAVDLIEPAGFDISDRSLKRAGMDYLEQAALTRHADWRHFDDWRRARNAASCFCRPGRRSLIRTTRFRKTTFFCSDANPPASPIMCMTPPMRASSSR